jgi:hypothetical protein
LGVEEATKEIVAVVTESRVHESRRVPALLAQIPDPIGRVSGDGAYDTRACSEAVRQRGAARVCAPLRTAQLCARKAPTGWRAARRHLLQQMAAQGALRGG